MKLKVKEIIQIIFYNKENVIDKIWDCNIPINNDQIVEINYEGVDK